MSIHNKHISVFFATFSVYLNGKRMPTNGFIQPVLSFFLPKAHTLLLLDQPHPLSDTVDPFVELYQQRKLKKKFRIKGFFYLPIYLFCTIPSKSYTRMSYKLRDFFSVLFVALKEKRNYDLFIGLEAVNTLAGIFLKKIGIVRTVVYYVSDYAPRRFGTGFFNRLYLWLDRFCLMHADFTWDVSPGIQKGRVEAGLTPLKPYRIIHVPNALFTSQITPLPIARRSSNSLVYMGILDADMGPDLAIKALKEVKNEKPQTMLHIVGGSKDGIEKLRKLASNLGIENSVIFYGIIENNEEMVNIIRHAYIGLAPYRDFPNTWRRYGDAGKIRQYLASGLPIVTTHVPPLGQYIAKMGAAIMVKDTVKEFAKGIVTLLSDAKLYRKLSMRARYISRDNTWENTYSKALKAMHLFNESSS